MSKPSYDEATLAAYFQPVDPATFDDPVAGPALRELLERDPDVLLAVADVDRSQIRDALAMAPDERLRAADRMAAGFAALRRAAR